MQFKVHLANKILEEKMQEKQELNNSLTEKREKLARAENEHLGLKMEHSKLSTSLSHQTVEVDFMQRSINKFSKKHAKCEQEKSINTSELG